MSNEPKKTLPPGTYRGTITQVGMTPQGPRMVFRVEPQEGQPDLATALIDYVAGRPGDSELEDAMRDQQTNVFLAAAAVRTALAKLTDAERVEALYLAAFCKHCGQDLTLSLGKRVACHCQNDE